MKKILILTAITVLLIACCDVETVPSDYAVQPVLFEYEYVNHAWVYTHFGWMIDSNGQIKGYSQPKSWNFTDEDGYISKDDLKENLMNTDTTYGSVNKDKMLKYFDDRFELLYGRVDTADTYMADAGVSLLAIYVWDADKEMYNKKTLATKGDIQLTNKNIKAKPIINWLIEVGQKTDHFFWN